MAGQMQRRVPAAGQTQTIGFDLCRAARMCHRDGPQSLPAHGTCHRSPNVDRAILDHAGTFAAVDDGGDFDTGGHQIAGGAAGIIIVGKNRHALARCHPVTVQIAANG